MTPSIRALAALVPRWEALLILGVLFSGCASRPNYAVPPQISSAGTPTVALYWDRGVRRESVVATHFMFARMGLSVERVGAKRIHESGLAGFDLFCVPGGNMYVYAHDLSSEGRKNIRQFVRSGGGYMGICGGAYFAARKVVWCGLPLPMEPLALFPGVAQGPLYPLGPFAPSICRLQRGASENPLTAALPDPAWMLYWKGPQLIPDDSARAAVVGEYARVNLPAVLALEHGRGRVFLTGPHPEIEGTSDRNGLSLAQSLDDKGANWGFMKAAAEWCLRATSLQGEP